MVTLIPIHLKDECSCSCYCCNGIGCSTASYAMVSTLLTQSLIGFGGGGGDGGIPFKPFNDSKLNVECF